MDIYLLLYWEFFKIGLFCVGGGYANRPRCHLGYGEDVNKFIQGQPLVIIYHSSLNPRHGGITATYAEKTGADWH